MCPKSVHMHIFLQLTYLPIVQETNVFIPTILLLNFMFLKSKTYILPAFVSYIQLLAQKHLQESAWTQKSTIPVLQ